jgi:beta-N-acetylhexosaminidase
MNIRISIITLALASISVSSRLPAQLLPADTAWVENTLKHMTLDEQIGQLFMPVHRDVAKTTEWIKNCNIGGIWFARTEARKIAEELNTLQLTSKYPLLVSADFEKGAGTYVDGATDLPFNMGLGATRDPRIVYRSAALTSKEAKAMGVHIIFAPVLDVNNNPKNPVINARSFGENAEMVATLGVAAINGYQDNGILATGKHFPGHGNTRIDTHAKLGIIESTTEEFESIELLPYKKVLREAKPSAIMSAHLWVKSVDSDTLPATLSNKVMTGLLRQRLGFDGVIYTDAMVMGGITTRYPFDVAVVKAIQAGCDVILFPGSVEKGIEALRAAVKNGDLSEERITASARRILLSKTRVNLHRERLVNLDKISSSVGTSENYGEAKAIATECLTLAKDENNLIPVSGSKKVTILTISNREGNSMLSRGLFNFPEEMRKRSANVLDFTLSDSLREDEMAKAFELAKSSDVVVVAAYVRIVLSSGTVELPEAHTKFLEQLAVQNPNIILVSFGNPYIGGSVPGIPTYVCAYDNAKALQDAAADALFGKAHFKGKLPITVSESMKSGSGLMR